MKRAERLEKEEKARKERENRENGESRGQEKAENKRRLRLAREREVRQLIADRCCCCFHPLADPNWANGWCVREGCRRKKRVAVPSLLVRYANGYVTMKGSVCKNEGVCTLHLPLVSLITDHTVSTTSEGNNLFYSNFLLWIQTSRKRSA